MRPILVVNHLRGLEPELVALPPASEDPLFDWLLERTVVLEWHVDAFVREAPARLRRQGEETGAVIREFARLREQALTAFS